MKRKVFTLIELMIVFLIIMVAAAILSFSGRINNAGNMAIKNAYCAVVEPKKDMDFGHYLKFFEIRFKDNLGELVPKHLVKFIIFSPYVVRQTEQNKLSAYEVDLYPYTSFVTVNERNVFTRSKAPLYSVSLNKTEINGLYAGRGNISRREFKVADIKKLHKELVERYGEESYPNFTFGAEMDKYGNITATAPLEAYQNGTTMVLPVTYGGITMYKGKPYKRFFMNLNNPTVREYAIRTALKQLKNTGGNLIYIDNAFIQRVLICKKFYETDCSEANTLHYISEGDENEQIDIYAGHMNYIFSEIKRRGNNAEILLNGFGLRQANVWRVRYMNYLFENGIDNFNGVLRESRFWKDDTLYAGGYREYMVTDIEYYRGWILKLKEKNIKFLFAAQPPHSANVTDELYLQFQTSTPFIYNLWLWYHLVAEDNTYFAISPHWGFQKPVINYNIYDYPLGNPLEAPHKEGDTWYRKYERGTIVFNTSSGRLDAIKFIE